MASTPYSVGTITVANGDTAVAGTNTFWIGKVRINDMLFIPAQGLMARVTADPNDNEALVITSWAGTSLVDAAYEIIPAADATTSAARLRDLLAQMSVIEANGRGLFYRFSDSVIDVDPGAGYLRLNNAAIGSATAAYIDNLDANGATVSAILDSWDDEGTPVARGQFWLRSISDPTAFHAFKVSGSVVDGTGYRKLNLAYVGGSSTFAADDEMMVMFSAQGADGTNAILGVWQGPWVTAFAYDVDDLVQQGGSTYICVEAHTSGTFAADLAADKWELAIEKGDTGADSTVPGPIGPKGINWQGTYSGATAYVLDDGVLYNGSSWRALGGTTGNAPPTLPTTSNAYWYLVARQGIDGAGTVNSIVAGAGIAVDNTDPTAPIISFPTFGDLFVTVSLLALQVADNTNVTLFLGPTGNRVADSFDVLTYVDVAGGTNLDTSVAGLLKPSLSGALISTSGKTKIGNMTGGGGLAAAFDGNTSQGLASSAQLNPSTTGFANTVGIDWGSGVTKTITRFKVYGPSDGNILGAAGGTTLKLQGSTDNFASSIVDLTSSQSFPTGSAQSLDVTTGITTSTAYRYHRVILTGNSTNYVAVAELQFYEAVATNNLTVSSSAFTAAAAPTKMKALIRVKEVDAAIAGTDYTLECSRDGGTTWAVMALTELFTSPSPTASIRVVQAAETDVSGQPSGTAPRWRFKTPTGKMVELHDVYFYWN